MIGSVALTDLSYFLLAIDFWYASSQAAEYELPNSAFAYPCTPRPFHFTPWHHIGHRALQVPEFDSVPPRSSRSSGCSDWICQSSPGAIHSVTSPHQYVSTDVNTIHADREATREGSIQQQSGRACGRASAMSDWQFSRRGYVWGLEGESCEMEATQYHASADREHERIELFLSMRLNRRTA